MYYVPLEEKMTNIETKIKGLKKNDDAVKDHLRAFCGVIMM